MNINLYITNLYKGLLNYIWNTKSIPYIDISDNSNDIHVPILLQNVYFLKESDMLERHEIIQILSENKIYRMLYIKVPRYYSFYLFCHLIFDILDILSNELFFVQTQIHLSIDKEIQNDLIQEFKDHIKKNIPFLQRHRILPIYIKFLQDPSYQIDYNITFDKRFHILFIKESEESLSIQRLHFSIDL
jgi:hypothetical protein